MLLKKLHLLVAVGISSILVACGPSCVSMCEKAQEEDEACISEVGSTDPADCEAYCEDVESIVDEENGDCEEDLDELLSCMDDADDACDALSDECDDEFAEVTDCIGDYCFDNPNDDACEDSFGF